MLTGASAGPAIDDDLPEAEAVSWRAPYQTGGTLRRQINRQKVEYVDMHLSHVPQTVAAFSAPDAVSRRIARHVVEFLLNELAARRLERDCLVFQAGVGNVANAVLYGLGAHPDIPPFRMYSEFMTPSTAKDGKVSAIVPMCPHIDNNEHSVRIIVTEQGLADLRGLGPMQRARTIIEHCAHPAYRDYLASYLAEARQGHIRHDLSRCFERHRNLMEYGQMLPGGGYTGDER